MFLGFSKRHSRTLQRLVDECGKIFVRTALDVIGEATREDVDYGQYRAFARVGHGIVRIVVSHGNRFRKRERRETVQLTGGIAHTLEELSHNRARVTPGTVQQRIGHCRQQGSQVLVIALLKDGQCCAERQAQVGAGITVRYREYVYLVE